MQKPCFRCEGKGVLPEFKHIMNGICFTCGGDGVVTTFSTISLNRKQSKEEIRDYVYHSSNRDLAELFKSGNFVKLKPEQQAEARKELTQRAQDFYQLDPKSFSDTAEMAGEVIKKLDKLEAEVPKTYENEWYWKNGKVDLVPIHWLKKFQGNPLRRSDVGMREFAEQLRKEGIEEVPFLMIGQEDRFVKLGEGNHRMNAYLMLGMDYLPVRVSRSTTNSGGYAKFYDKMSRVPQYDYFVADERPTKVFDTFYDLGATTEPNEKNMKKIGYNVVDIGEMDFEGSPVRGFYVKEESEAVLEVIRKSVKEYIDLGMKSELAEILDNAYADWFSKEDGILAIKHPSDLLERLGAETEEEELELDDDDIDWDYEFSRGSDDDDEEFEEMSLEDLLNSL